MRIMAMAAIVAVCMLGACAPKDTSPVIACEMGGKIVSTDFTFNSFKATLAAEHGKIVAEPNKSLKSKSLEVTFKPLNDGRLLAERAVLTDRAVAREMAPAVLFGLTNAVPRASAPAVPIETPTGAATNQ